MRYKTIFAGLASLAVLSMNFSQAWAWCLLKNCCCCGCKYSTYICCRPYNAFTPVCFGSICCNGCCPVSCCPPGGCGLPMCCPPGPGMGNYGPPPNLVSCAPLSCPPGCTDISCQPVPAVSAPNPPIQTGPPPTFTPPMPTPLSPHAWNYAMPQGVQQAGYYAGYNPLASWGYWPSYAVGSAPSYWYGN